uniref:Sm domain-containing protein n=1 Tax=Zonotrichia albicollis TaxID=44394 RepID=A0A8D2MGM0_ZONAL
MLPQACLKCSFPLVELKNGETYNGHLVSCDNWMNINLREVICTSRVRLQGRELHPFLQPAQPRQG